MSIFDPTAILSAEQTSANTRRPPLPTGQEYIGIIQPMKIRTWTNPKDNEDIHFLDVPLKIQVPAELQEEIGSSELTIIHSIRLDLTESGTLDNSPGKNMGQRQYREATGNNVDGQVFSWNSIVGTAIQVELKHREYNGDLFEDVKAIRAL